MLLSEILYGISIQASAGDMAKEVSSITFDSRKVQENTLFVAVPGTQVDGHQFIETAISNGATAILCEQLPSQLSAHVTYVQVSQSAQAMGLAASNFYNHPSKKVRVVGITGTNGKTSIATMLFRLYRHLGYRCGLLSTVQNQIEDEVIPSTHTTPDSVTIQQLLHTMHERGCQYVFMEVSSHAVVMERIAGIHFAGGVFTNITQDHLDFHGTFSNYIKAKQGFFDILPTSAFALTNADDRNGKIMIQNTNARRESYSLKNVGTFKGKLLSCGLAGIEMTIDNQDVWFKLIGQFNAYNLLAVYGTAVLLGNEPAEILTYLSNILPPPGRFERVFVPNAPTGIVDYAHTPDALKNVLETIVNLREGNQKIITVVGCGGNRDKGKRPLMADIACTLSDHVILTSDNPRLEDPKTIIEEMYAGVKITHRKKTEILEDRREAIRKAIALANPSDIILVAGKGHEDYQDIQGVKHHFDDREELRNGFHESLNK